MLLAFLQAGCRSDTFGNVVGEGSGGGVGTAAVTITSRFPGSDAVTVNFNESVTFFVSAVTRRRNGILYKWTLDSVQLQLGETSDYVLNGASFPIGTYTLICQADDGLNTADAKWTVKVNGPPSITSITPTTAISRTSYITPLDFSVTASDPNLDTLIYTWRFDGDSTIMTNNGSMATLTPDASMVGAHNVTVEVSDGSLTASWTWPVEVNYFYNPCNLLALGQVCTSAGMITVGNTLNPQTSGNQFRIQPRGMHFDDIDNLYVADDVSGAIYYWNRSAATVVRHGVSVAANSMTIIAGSGVPGFGGDGGPALSAQLNNAYDMVYDPFDGALYISDFSNNRVRHVDSFGNIATLATASTVGGQDCNGPIGIALQDPVLWVACSSRHVIYSIVLRGAGVGTVTREVGV